MPRRDLQPLSGGALWMAGILLAVANFVAVLDMTIANVSVPNIAGGLGASASQGTWVITSYSVAEAITVPLTGWLANRFGALRVFCSAIIGFGVTSFLCGLAPSLGVLVVCRVMQGFSGGPLLPLSQTLLLQIFPKKQQPAAMGLWAVTTLVAPIMGPILGGQLCDNFGWPAIFLVNVPIALLFGPIIWRFLAYYNAPGKASRIDAVGLALLILWVGGLQLILDLGKDQDWFSSPIIVVGSIVVAVGFIAFLIWELHEKEPVVDLRVFRHLGFSTAMVTLALAFGAFFATNVLTPLWLQSNMGYTATWSGNVTAWLGVLAVLSAPIIAQSMTKIDPRLIIFIGISWLAITTFFRGHATNDMSYSQIAIWLFVAGIGVPMFFIPLTTVALGSVNPEETASAAGLQNFIRTVSGAFATSIVTTVWDNNAQANHVAIAPHLNDVAATQQGLQMGGFSLDQAVGLVDQIVQGQSIMLATDQVFLACSVVFAFAAAVVWLSPRPAREVDMTAAH